MKNWMAKFLVVAGVVEIAVLAYWLFFILPTLTSVYSDMDVGFNGYKTYALFAITFFSLLAEVVFGLRAQKRIKRAEMVSTKFFWLYILVNIVFFKLALLLIFSETISPLYNLTNAL